MDLHDDARLEQRDDDPYGEWLDKRWDDRGVPTLLITLAPPAPLTFFGRAMQVIADIAPAAAVVKMTERGYEVWSRPPIEPDHPTE